MGILNQFREKNQPYKLMEAYLRYRPLITRPNGNDVLRLLAWAYEQGGLKRRSAKLYEVLISRGLTDPELRLAMARDFLAERMYPEVVKALEAPEVAGYKGEQAAQAQSMLGRSLARLGRHEQAVKVLEALLAAEPQPPSAGLDLAELGRSLAALGRDAPALAALDQALTLLADQPEESARTRRYLVAMQAGELALKMKDYPKAVSYYKRAEGQAQAKADKAQALYQLAQAWRGQRRIQEMSGVFKQVAGLGADPWSSMARRHLEDLRLAPSLAQIGK